MTWQFPPSDDPPADLLELAGHPLLARLLAQRGLTDPTQAAAFLDPACYQPAPPTDLPDVTQAVARLTQAIERQELVCVWGDFDVDGQTSTTLLVSMLQALGGRVTYYIPNRLTESHGVKLPALHHQIKQGIDLLLTCDTGIDAHEAVAAAHAAGVEVIITDHHDLPEHLPPAQAVINPKRLPPDHPLRDLPGVGVAYKLAQALYQQHGQSADHLLDLVALGIVADVARQTADTRYLLQRGLAALRRTGRVGLHALLENARLSDSRRLTEEHIGFWLAPRLNALGRLGDANLAVELLTTADEVRAKTIALQLEAFNDRRKLLVDKVVVQALSLLEDTPSLAEYNAIVLAGSEWHPGVIGLAASRLVAQYHKPAILISLRPGEPGRGSARSLPGCDIHQAIKSQGELLHTFGGHPMAAGLSLPPENLANFRRGLSAALAGCAPAAPPQVRLDAVVSLSQISGDLLAVIQRLAPFGPGNPPVMLGCTGLTVVDEQLFGKTRAHKRLRVQDEQGVTQPLIWWGGAAQPTPAGRFDLAFTLSPDDYRGGDAVQVEWRAARLWDDETPVRHTIEVIDWRSEGRLLEPEVVADDGLIWAEGPPPVLDQPTAFRTKLQPARRLVIWSAPPGQDILAEVVARVQPQEIYLVGRPSPLDAFEPFVRQLLGLVKYAIGHKAGEIVLPELAGALGQRQTTAQLGLDWLVAQGKLRYSVEDEETALLLVHQTETTPDARAAADLRETLQAALTETAAFRAFFRQAGLPTIRRMLAEVDSD